MKARTALLELFKESYEWRNLFRSCCEISALRLRSQAWRFRDELNGQDHGFRTDEMEDALLGLARELLPDTPTARWDAEWAHELCKDALARLSKRHAELTLGEVVIAAPFEQDLWCEGARVAGLANDPVAFREALESWVRAVLETMEQVGVKGGVA